MSCFGNGRHEVKPGDLFEAVVTQFFSMALGSGSWLTSSGCIEKNSHGWRPLRCIWTKK